MTTENQFRIRVIYTRLKPSCYISHLDMIDIICKALRRLGLPYLTTQGCHSRPKISFSAPLPLGHESRCEEFCLSLSEQIDRAKLAKDLSEYLPTGMQVISVEDCINETSGANGDYVEYLFGFSNEQTAQTAMNWLSKPDTTFEILSKGKIRTYRLTDSVQKLELLKKDGLTFLEGHFIQGKPKIPSVSKIVTALSEFLADRKEDLEVIERVRLEKL